MMKKNVLAALGAIMLAAGAHVSPASAGDLVFTPVNPSFGGNPLNSSHLLGLANAQRTATARERSTSGGGAGDPGTPPGSTDADLFVRQLQGRLLSALASQVTEAIFGAQPQESGNVRFGDTTVSFERTLDSIRLVIQDSTGTTEIVVPQLVTSSGLN
jgi:curli production assembly/transport component CsgF